MKNNHQLGKMVGKIAKYEKCDHLQKKTIAFCSKKIFDAHILANYWR